MPVHNNKVPYQSNYNASIMHAYNGVGSSHTSRFLSPTSNRIFSPSRWISATELRTSSRTENKSPQAFTSVIE